MLTFGITYFVPNLITIWYRSRGLLMITIRENKITTEQIPSVCPTPTVKKLCLNGLIQLYVLCSKVGWHEAKPWKTSKYLLYLSQYLQAPIKTTGSQALKAYPPEVPITQTYELIWAFSYLCINYKKENMRKFLWEENQMRT